MSLENLRKFLKSRSAREVFATRPVYKGRIYAADKDQRWAADIIDYTKTLPLWTAACAPTSC